jgi:DNA-binding response OmpR family regulator
MLRGLASRQGRPLSPGELLAAICGLVFDPAAKIVDVCVRRSGASALRFDKYCVDTRYKLSC